LTIFQNGGKIILQSKGWEASMIAYPFSDPSLSYAKYRIFSLRLKMVADPDLCMTEEKEHDTFQSIR